MTKKDYIKIAKVLKETRQKARNKGELEVIRHIITEMGKILKADNILFDAEKFEKAIYNIV